jgi:hypothetical protein
MAEVDRAPGEVPAGRPGGVTTVDVTQVSHRRDLDELLEDTLLDPDVAVMARGIAPSRR